MNPATHPWRRGTGFSNTTVGPHSEVSPAVTPAVRYSSKKDHPPEVETALLRAAFERSGLSKGELAARMGFMRANVDHLNRTLGYKPDYSAKGRRHRDTRQRVNYDLAVRLCKAMGANPFECGV